MEIKISVRNLVEFILRSGDIDNRRHASADNAMAEGGRIHRMIQKRMGSDYDSEVPLSFCYETEKYNIILDGRADGVLHREVTTIDEIKGTYRHLEKMTEPIPVHLAQAKCYAYMYAAKNELDQMAVRMTYCNMDTEDIRYFDYQFEMEELKDWFLSVLKEYQKWADLEFEWSKLRQLSIKNLQFPFIYRNGQKELASYVYQTIVHKKKLFLEAPTGVGKTISTVFPAVKAIGEEKAQRLFYFTAKTITRTVAENTFAILRENGLRFKSVVITAKEKICFMDEVECNPGYCPYARGHLDRINDALYDLLTHEESFSRELIEEYAKKHNVCPFEMNLDISLFSDGIICDYNYLFDPHVYLKRFFAEGNKGEYLFLIDEAHNLIDRGRDMYSAELVKEDFLTLKKTVKVYDTIMSKQLEKCNHEFLMQKRECNESKVLDDISVFVRALERLYTTMEDYLENHDESPVREEVLEFYFKVSHFLLIYEIMDNKYITYDFLQSDGSFVLKLFCVDPSKNLAACMERGVSTILFSATLLPIRYHKKLLGGTDEDYEVYAESTFDSEKRALMIANDVTSKYTRRGISEYKKIASYIYQIVKKRTGNYFSFFPSHTFLQNVYDAYVELYGDDEDVECLVQSDFMKEEEREAFVNRFTGNNLIDLSGKINLDIEVEQDKSLVGFCVMGGIFSEGIDLKNDSLIGAIIIGTGIPQVCLERELIKSYFDERDGNGYDYAYLYPGMNKVLQAAGRVIRTNEDIGIVALLDERFLFSSYRKLFPREWNHFDVVDHTSIDMYMQRFWDDWIT